MLLHALGLEFPNSLFAMEQIYSLFEEHFVDLVQVDWESVLWVGLLQLIHSTDKKAHGLFLTLELQELLVENRLFFFAKMVDQPLHGAHFEMKKSLNLWLRRWRPYNLLRFWLVWENASPHYLENLFFVDLPL